MVKSAAIYTVYAIITECKKVTNLTKAKDKARYLKKEEINRISSFFDFTTQLNKKE